MEKLFVLFDACGLLDILKCDITACFPHILNVLSSILFHDTLKLNLLIYLNRIIQ